jgi:hypothetical protein
MFNVIVGMLPGSCDVQGRGGGYSRRGCVGDGFIWICVVMVGVVYHWISEGIIHL